MYKLQRRAELAQEPPSTDGGSVFLEREDPELGKERSEEREGFEEGNRGDLVC